MNEENVVAIAVAGLGCRFPGANDKGIVWSLRQKEKNHITDLKSRRPGFDYSYYTAGVVERINKVFGMKDKEEKWVNPQEQFVLESMLIVIDNETRELCVYHPHDDKLLAMLDKLMSQARYVCVVKMSILQVILTADSQKTILAVEPISKSAVIRCDMTLNVLRTLDICLEVKASRYTKRLAVSGGGWAECNKQDNCLCICWDIVSLVTEYVDTVHTIREWNAFSYLATSSSDSIVYTSCWIGPHLSNTKARFCRKEFKYCYGDLPGSVAIYVESRGFIYVCNKKPLSFHQQTGIEEPVTVHNERMPALVWATYLMEKQRESYLKIWRR